MALREIADDAIDRWSKNDGHVGSGGKGDGFSLLSAEDDLRDTLSRNFPPPVGIWIEPMEAADALDSKLPALDPAWSEGIDLM